MMRNPFNLNYVIQSGMKDTWKACTAVKAAELQGEEKMLKFYRKLMEEIQIQSRDGSKDEVLTKVARESSLDVKKFEEDLHGEKAATMFREDRHRMAADRGNFFSLLVMSEKSGKGMLVSGYTSEEYEKAIDLLSKDSLEKKIPIDMIEYFDRRAGNSLPPGR